MYHNPFAAGYEVLAKSGYNIDSHGSLSNTASYLVTNDFPDYAAMFYSPSQHETRTSIKYGNFEQGYDHNLQEVRESMNSDHDLYVPNFHLSSDGVGRQDVRDVSTIETGEKLMDKVNREVLQEIAKAQQEAVGNKPNIKAGSVKRVVFEDMLLMRRIRRISFFEEKK